MQAQEHGTVTTHNRACAAAQHGETQLITSPHNAAISRIRALRGRKERARSGLAFAEGIRLVVEAARQPAALETLVVAPDLLTSALAHDLLREQRAAGTACLYVSAAVFGTLASRERPQGLGAVVRQRWQSLELAAHADRRCWVALEAVQDPGNLGTILRTADAVGAAGVILLGPATDPYDPAAMRASMGAVFTQQLVRAQPAELAQWVRQRGIGVVGTSGAAPDDYRAIAYPRPLVLLMGSERQGLSAEQQALCDRIVRIPMVGHADSLNLAVATSLVLYEIFHQYRI
jgi:TrmH family RNA methyltransferase